MIRPIKFYVFFFIFFSLKNIKGQVRIKGNINYPPDEYKEMILDTTQQNIYYEYIHLAKPDDKSIIKNSLTVLQIGDKYSKFIDRNKLKRDSLEKKFSRLKNIGTNEINQLLQNKIIFKKEVIKDLLKDSLIIQGRVFTTRYKYKEKTPVLNWQLVHEKKSILNYNVKKAVVNYGKRKWIAWYTEEIPIALGPYVFGNLPGLILELYDEKKNFHFIAIGIDNTQNPIYIRDEKKIVDISKDDFLKAERNFHNKPELFIGGGYKGINRLRKRPYNPIEIID
jgi:GLPGLI family protein